MPGNSRPQKFTRAANNNADNVLGPDDDENEDEDDEIDELIKISGKHLTDISACQSACQLVWPTTLRISIPSNHLSTYVRLHGFGSGMWSGPEIQQAVESLEFQQQQTIKH
uniref:HDC13416 n=1 Tax=Drosophila melanogaster TaxID=7227 RepID=Q6IK43_DROME|nr:TPA_inf: HDC13416 [Drosophila melanogaster]